MKILGIFDEFRCRDGKARGGTIGAQQDGGLNLLPSSDTPDAVDLPHTNQRLSHPHPLRLTFCDKLFIMLAIPLYIFDVLTDIYLVVRYNLDGTFPRYYWIATLTIILFNYVVCVAYGIRSDLSRKKGKPLLKGKDLAVNIIGTIFGLGPVVRYVKTILYDEELQKVNMENDLERERTAKQEKKPYEEMEIMKDVRRTEMDTGAILFGIENVLESCPQAVFQLSILLNTHSVGNDTCSQALTIVAIAISCLSLPYDFVSYYAYMTKTKELYNEFSMGRKCITWLWRICEVESRILVLAVMFSWHWLPGVVFIVVDWLFTILWVLAMDCIPPGYNVRIDQHTRETGEKVKGRGWRALLLILVVLSNTFSCTMSGMGEEIKMPGARYVVRYTFWFIWHMVAVSLWWRFYEGEKKYLVCPIVFGVVLGLFILMVSFQAYGYLHCHPSSVEIKKSVVGYCTCKTGQNSQNETGVEEEEISLSIGYSSVQNEVMDETTI